MAHREAVTDCTLNIHSIQDLCMKKNTRGIFLQSFNRQSAKWVGMTSPGQSPVQNAETSTWQKPATFLLLLSLTFFFV